LEAESIQSLTPLLQQADQWAEVLVLLPLLVALEIVLSADNAIALAAIARGLDDPASQRQALNLGLALALVFRLALIVAAQWVLNFWPLQLLAAGYLFWLCASHLIKVSAPSPPALDAPAELCPPSQLEPGQVEIGNPGPGVLVGAAKGLSSVVITLALTDLAFSLDSVAAAVAVTDRLLLVMAGGVAGVVALRLTAELFIRWLEQYQHLETAGYLAVGFVGFRLLLRLLVPDFDLPEWSLLLLVAVLFAWGFSKRNPLEAAELPDSARG
jgi:YkoY family integral membrane protein